MPRSTDDIIVFETAMRAPAHLAILTILAAGASAMAQEPEPGLLEQAREAAMRYSDSLPDFICTEVVRRSLDPQGNGRWRRVDTLTVKLSYFEHKEDYKLMLIDGKPTVIEYQYLGGTLSTGEFGTSLYALFDRRSQSEFRWKGWTTLRKRRAARFSFHIARENSVYRIQNGPILKEGPSAIIVPYHGEVFVDEETHLPLRYTQQAEIPPGFPIESTGFTVDYEFAAVGGKQYLLPSQAHVKTRIGRLDADNTVEFLEYRKFQTETNITFDPPPGKQ